MEELAWLAEGSTEVRLGYISFFSPQTVFFSSYLRRSVSVSDEIVRSVIPRDLAADLLP